MLRMVYAVWRRGRREDKRVGKDKRERERERERVWSGEKEWEWEWEWEVRGGKGEK